MTPPRSISHNDALVIVGALTELLSNTKSSWAPFAANLERGIHEQRACYVNACAMHGYHVEHNEERHGRLCGWVAAQLGVAGAAADRAGKHYAEMLNVDDAVRRGITHAEALVVGQDIVVNRALSALPPMGLIDTIGRLMTAVACEAIRSGGA